MRRLAVGFALALSVATAPGAWACESCPKNPASEAPAAVPVAPTEPLEEIAFVAAATPSADPEALLVTLEAERVEAVDDEAGYVTATGKVRAVYDGITLTADGIHFDRVTMRGEASGSVRLSQGIHHLKAERIRFDLATRTIDADDWQATIERQAWFGGRRLHFTPDLAYSEDVRVSPCAQEDPGYWFAGDRLDWYPKRKTWNLSGRWVKAVVGGVPVMVIPYFVATIGQAAQRFSVGLQDTRIDANVGFNDAQGIFVDSRTPYQLGPDMPGAVPVRVMSSRGVSAGVIQDFPAPAEAHGRFDANYTQYFPWLTPDKGRQGPHANLSFTKDWGGARSIMNVGYRVDVGRRNDEQYQVDPGGFPVHRLPELTTTWPAVSLGPVTLGPSVRAGYIFEENSGTGSGVTSAGLSLGLPSWNPNAFWSTGFYGGASTAYYTGDRSQSVLSLGMGNAQRWAPWFTTNFNLETQPVYKTGGGTPFLHDGATAVDRVVVGSNLNIYGPWSLGSGAWWARNYDKPFAVDSFGMGDLWFGLRYAVNCLSLGVTFRPPRPGQPFTQFSFDYQLAGF
ncbi:MAG TPA: hypothetical protein V6D00_02470 [Pantanalinema sp.]